MEHKRPFSKVKATYEDGTEHEIGTNDMRQWIGKSI